MSSPETRPSDDSHFLEYGETIREFVESKRTPTPMKVPIYVSLDKPPASYLYLFLIPPEGTRSGDRIKNIPGGLSYMVYGPDGIERGIAEGHQVTQAQFERIEKRVQEELDRLHVQELLEDTGLH